VSKRFFDGGPKMLGRLHPHGLGLLDIAAPAWDMGPAIVTAMHVRQGDWVEPGQMLAELRGRDELDAVLAGRERKVAVARARLAAVKTGGKEDDIRALRSEVESDEVALAQVQADTTRTQQLREEGVVSAAAMQAQRSRLIAASRSLDAKRARLNALSSLRPADISVGEAELQAAEAEAQEILVKLESTLVRAPAAGRVLAVHAYPGQRVGAEGLLTLGQTQEMFVNVCRADLDVHDAGLRERSRVRLEHLARADDITDLFDGAFRAPPSSSDSSTRA
jgi:HlyD family secretion protein